MPHFVDEEMKAQMVKKDLPKLESKERWRQRIKFRANIRLP